MNNNTLHFCTLFDSAYLSRGLALYQSLLQHAPAFHLYVLAMDNRCAELLTEKSLPHLTVITLQDFETPALLAVKAQRTRGEYCWTCTPFIIRYCLEQFKLDACTYLDADIYFFASPKILLDEIPAEKSVLITEHRYTAEFDQTNTAGRFCVQFVCFKNTGMGNFILNNWASQCEEWCFARIEPNRFGDQKYQDAWPQQWPNDVHILQHLGGGVAPWNIQQYDLQEKPQLSISSTLQAAVPVVFYHYHAMLFIDSQHIHLGGYPIPPNALMPIYVFYARLLLQISSELTCTLPLGPLTTPPNLFRRYLPLLKGQKPKLINKLKIA